MAESSVVTVRLEAAVKRRLEALAERTKRSKSYLAAEAIAAYVELNAWQIEEIEAGLRELDEGEVITEEQAGALYDRLLK